MSVLINFPALRGGKLRRYSSHASRLTFALQRHSGRCCVLRRNRRALWPARRYHQPRANLPCRLCRLRPRLTCLRVRRRRCLGSSSHGTAQGSGAAMLLACVLIFRAQCVVWSIWGSGYASCRMRHRHSARRSRQDFDATFSGHGQWRERSPDSISVIWSSSPSDR
jgi:hypothetical protein